MQSPRSVTAAYDARADEYTSLLGTLDQQTPDNRDLVQRWCRSVEGPMLDAGSGPGHWTKHLQDLRTTDVIGLDLSARFLTIAQNRGCRRLARGSLEALPLASASMNAVLAWYSVIHTPPQALSRILAELGRVLTPGGSLLLGFFHGPPAQPFPHKVTTAWTWTAASLADLLRPAGLQVVEQHQREHPGHRTHGDLTAKKLPTVLGTSSPWQVNRSNGSPERLSARTRGSLLMEEAHPLSTVCFTGPQSWPQAGRPSSGARTSRPCSERSHASDHRHRVGD